MWFAPRYRFCVPVDEIALQSILKYGKRESTGYRGHVNVIEPYLHIPDPSSPDYTDEIAEGIDIHDQGEEPIKGSRMIEVGWMRCDVGFLLSTLYGASFKLGNSFEFWYRRPPFLGGDGFSDYLPPDDIPLPKA
jgi:hypothetical protein